MKPCPHCGSVSATQYQFCPSCGQPLDGADAVGQAFQPDKAHHAKPAVSSDVTTPINFLGQPGRSVPADVFTSQAVPPGVVGAPALHRTVSVEQLFALKSRLVIGRSPGCDICLPHPSISRTHALLEKVPGGIRLRDLHSVNGIWVSGRRAVEPVLLRERERIGIGPFLFCLADGVLHALDSSQSLRLEARKLDKLITVGRGQTRKLLDGISLAVEPGEFVSLLGPSGSGKSTLMDCLNGRRRASGGQVLANGEDFYRHFDSFRQSLGYVPQRDIVHAQLPVSQALYYTARLRLPPDTSPAELQARIHDVLELMELEPHKGTLVGQLSGGQIKRVSLGAELLGRPCLLYIDEATSGLDAGTEARMMKLFRRLSHEGKSVLCITHNVDHVDLCDLVLVLNAGRLVFYGPPAESLAYFRIRRISELYDRLSEKDAAAWQQDFAACSLHRTYVADRLAGAPAESILTPAPPPAAAAAHIVGQAFQPDILLPERLPPAAAVRKHSHPFFHQYRVLTVRYLELLWRDYRTLRLLVLQAPLVASIIFLGFMHKPFQYEIMAARSLTPEEHATLSDWLTRLKGLADQQEKLDSALKRLQAAQPAGTSGDSGRMRQLVDKLHLSTLTVQQVCEKGDLLLKSDGPLVPEKLILDPTYTYILLCLVAITILWFGCNNAAKEIIKEEAVYMRERAVNLGILPYLASKFSVLSIISAVQVVLTMAIIYGGLEIMHLWKGHDVPAPIYRLDYLPQFGVLVLLAMTGVALGLFLSACVGNPDRAATLLPYVLVPQIILTGGILPLDSEPLCTIAKIAAPPYWAYRAIRTGETELPEGFPWRMDYDDSIGLACAALVAQMLGLLLLTTWMLRRWDVRKS